MTDKLVMNINFMSFEWANIQIIRCMPYLQHSSRSPSQNWLCPWLSLPALLLLFPQLREASQAFLLRSERRESYEAHKLRPPRSERGGGLDSGATSRRRMEVGTRGDESGTVFLGWYVWHMANNSDYSGKQLHVQWHPLKSEFLKNRGRYHKMVLGHHRRIF